MRAYPQRYGRIVPTKDSAGIGASLRARPVPGRLPRWEVATVPRGYARDFPPRIRPRLSLARAITGYLRGS